MDSLEPRSRDFCICCQEKMEYPNRSEYRSPVVLFICGHRAHYMCCREWINATCALCNYCKIERDQEILQEQQAKQYPLATIINKRKKRPPYYTFFFILLLLLFLFLKLILILFYCK